MRCPFCGHDDTHVKDSRPTEDNTAIRRRRVCPDCGARWTTFERVHLRDLMVVKKNGQRVPFDRDKLEASMRISLRKRPVDPERVDRVISGIVRRLESSGETDISTDARGSSDGRPDESRLYCLCAVRVGVQKFSGSTRFRGLHWQRASHARRRTD